MNKLTNVLWGIVLVTIGIIWGLNAMGITNIDIFFKGWWTLFIIIPCFIGLFKQKGRYGNFIGLIVGVILLLCAQGVLSITTISKLIVPFVLVAVGLGILINTVINSSISKKVKNIDKSNLASYGATFSEQRIDMTNQVFNGANLDAVFGGIKLDLQKAIINSDQVINASSIFAGITILVPNNINVKVKATPIFGGVTNKTNYKSGDNIPTIYINAFCMFGGVDIK